MIELLKAKTRILGTTPVRPHFTWAQRFVGKVAIQVECIAANNHLPQFIVCIE